MSNELKAKFKSYFDKFGDGFPTMEINVTDDECIKIIDECIKKGKNVYELGYVTLNDDIYY